MRIALVGYQIETRTSLPIPCKCFAANLPAKVKFAGLFQGKGQPGYLPLTYFTGNSNYDLIFGKLISPKASDV